MQTLIIIALIVLALAGAGMVLRLVFGSGRDFDEYIEKLMRKKD